MRHALMILSLVVVVAGCSPQAHTGMGRVRFDDGQPVRSGSIEFRAVSDGTRFSSRIGGEGEFQLADADGETGIDPGQYEVIVLQMVLTEDLAIENHRHGHTVPRRYADYYTTDLNYTVEADPEDRMEIVVGVE